jgi:hypothetical protein
MNNCIRLHPADDVVISRQQLLSGATVEGVAVRGLIPPGHKIATRAIASGDPVRRAQQLIYTSEDLRAITDEWERIWFLDQPSHMTPWRTHGGIL